MIKYLLKSRMLLTGIVAFGLIVIWCLTSPLFYNKDPYKITTQFFAKPSQSNWFGTDSFGRDLYIRCVIGTRMSLEVALGVAIFSTVLGILAGATAVLSGGIVHLLIMRVMDVIMAFPALLLAMAALAALGRNIINIVVVLSVVYMPRTARIVESCILAIKEMAYFEATYALGVPWWRRIVYHVLPNIIGPLVVQSTFVFAYAILAEAGLSFIGVGIQPPIPSLGNIIGDARDYFRFAPWNVWFPGAVIFVLVTSINLIGDGLRETVDPFLRGR